MENNFMKLILGITIDNKLNWKAHINDIALKLIRANVESHIHYACVIWRQNMCTINRIFILQKKALRLIRLKNVMLILLLSFSNQKL